MSDRHATPGNPAPKGPSYGVAADWPAPANVHAFTTTRGGPGESPPPFDTFNLGLRSGDEPAHALANRARLRADAALPSEPAWLHQVHGAGVVRVDRPARVGDAEPEADAAVTSAPGVVLAILTADCLPVLLCDRAGTEIGAAHAGWRGLADGVLEATVRAMRSDPGDLMAWLGPAAGPASYEIGAEVRDAFLRVDAEAEACFVATRAGHWRVDLYALATRRLRGVGVGAIDGGGFDTIADPRFYSHRREARTGRMATLAWIAPA
jgi:YfiH family protein